MSVIITLMLILILTYFIFKDKNNDNKIEIIADQHKSTMNKLKAKRNEIENTTK